MESYGQIAMPVKPECAPPRRVTSGRRVTSTQASLTTEGIDSRRTASWQVTSSRESSNEATYGGSTLAPEEAAGVPGDLRADGLRVISGASFCSAVSSPDEAAALAPGTSGYRSAVSSPGGRETPVQLMRRRTNLSYFHAQALVSPTSIAGGFTRVRGIGKCCREGKVELHQWFTLQGAPCVVVKRVPATCVYSNMGKEEDEHTIHTGQAHRDAEDTLNEIGVYCYLAAQRDVPRYLLRMLTCFSSGLDVWLILDHAEGGDLFSVVQEMHQSRGDITDFLPHIMTWTWQLMHAVAYLQRHCIGHRDVSIENVLLCQGEVRLMDFGQAVSTHASDGSPLRYDSAVGKHYYRPAECYVPRVAHVQVKVPVGASPGDVVFACADGHYLCDVQLPENLPAAGQSCFARPWGYEVPPVDIFAVAICLFIMSTGMPPWRQADINDQHYRYVYDHGLERLLDAWKKRLPSELVSLLSIAMGPTPSKRPTAAECLQHPWFAPLRSQPVPQQDVFEVPEAVLADSSPTAVDPGGEWSQSAFYTGMAGYHEPETHRSAASMAPAPLPLDAFSEFGGDFYGGDFDLQSGVMSADCAQPPAIPAASQAAPAALALERFSCEDLPPALPLGPGFPLTATTFELPAGGMAAGAVANRLVDFFRQAEGGCVSKVSRKKFSIKASIGDAAAPDACELKVRLYAKRGGALAVEFQRRAGDSLAVHRAYVQACEFLGSSSGGGDGGRSSSPAQGGQRSCGMLALPAPLPVEPLALAPVSPPVLRPTTAPELASAPVPLAARPAASTPAGFVPPLPPSRLAGAPGAVRRRVLPPQNAAEDAAAPHCHRALGAWSPGA